MFRNWRTGTLALGICTVVGWVGTQAALAQDDYPSRPIRIIVPAAPGGALDLTTRRVAAELAEQLDGTVIVENRAGGDTLLGTEAVKNAPSDGHTLLAQASGILALPALKPGTSFDPVRDLVPIGVMTRSPMIMEVGNGQPDQTIADFIDRAKSEPLAYASAGVGGPPHIAAALFLDTVGLDVLHVPYRGNGAALPDVVAGRVAMIFDAYPSSVSFLQSGDLRALAVSSEERMPNLPDVPTFKEQGIDYSYTLWLALFAPAGTPEPIAARLNEALGAALSDEALSQALRDMGSDPTPMTLGEFGEYYAEEGRRMGEFLAKLDLTGS